MVDRETVTGVPVEVGRVKGGMATLTGRED